MTSRNLTLNFSYVVDVTAADIACEQALLFGRAKRTARERASERRSREGARSREARFACPNRRACSQATADIKTSPGFPYVLHKP